MKKNKPRKLQLKRETLRALDLAAVQGGLADGTGTTITDPNRSVGTCYKIRTQCH